MSCIEPSARPRGARNRGFVRHVAAGIAVSTVLLAGCKEGVKSGSVGGSFAGVKAVTVLSPTAVKISWSRHDKYSEYQIYSSTQTEPLGKGIFEDITIENLTPETSYTFKVVGVGTNGSLSGGDRESSVTTWKRFTGPTEVVKDIDGNLVLSWEYDHSIAEYQVFYQKDSPPTASSTANWSAPNLVTNEEHVTFKGLDGASTYHFVVHAKYREGEVERPSKSVSETTGASFPKPSYSLAPISIGSLPFATINPVINSKYKEEYYTSQIFKDGAPISDPMVGRGTLIFSSQADLPLGPLENISIRFNYNDGTLNETLVATGLSTYLKGQASFLDHPSISAAPAGPAFLGSAMAAGDFNCDGYKDLAIGMPEASVASLGVKETRAGAVNIYYSYKKSGTDYFQLKTDLEPRVDPVIPGTDPQILTFDDLRWNAQFGKSLASGGNLNGDQVGLNSCEDLIVGAPGMYLQNRYGGGAVVFFGSQTGIKAPAHLADLQDNVETCDGQSEGANCAAVRIWPDHSQWPLAALGGPYTPTHNPETDRVGEFGFSVSFIGDFNADGYDDMAIGAPSASWDSVVVTGLPGRSGYIDNVGYVAVYFGSRYGLGSEYPLATTTPTSTDFAFRFLKIYPPVVESGMRFGAAVSGGADVDGGFKVRLASGNVAGGGDLLIGAPGFTYKDPNLSMLEYMSSGGPDVIQAIAPLRGGWKTASSGGVPFSSATSYYGVSQGNATTGAAFLYWGRTFGYTGAPTTGQVESPTRQEFWQCGKRGMTDGDHFSCLASNLRFKMLTPRNGSSQGFGSAVALLGDRSRFDETNTVLTSFQDPNGDGYAEVIVAANSGHSATQTSTGVLWQFFGNPHGFFEFDDFYNLYNDTNPTSDWIDSEPSCDSFATNNLTQKKNCAPTVLRSNSIPAGARLGRNPSAIAVGDITGDGVLDLAVGSDLDNTKGASSGSVYVFTGTTGQGLTGTLKHIYNASGDSDDRLGAAVAIGNFDGDVSPSGRPYNDIAAGAPGDEIERAGGGSVQIYLSNGLPMPSIKTTADRTIVDKLASLRDYGHEQSQIVGDLNGDGYDDALSRLARYDSSGNLTFDAVVFYGSKIGLVTSSFCLENLERVFIAGMGNESQCYPAVTATPGLTQDEIALPQLIIKPNNATGAWARYPFPAGDVNNDGFDDALFLDPAGQLIVYFGTRGGLQAIVNPNWNPATNDPQIVTKSPNVLPSSTDGWDSLLLLDLRYYKPLHVGDFNADGYSDLVIARPLASGPGGINVSSPLLPHPNHNAASDPEKIDAGEGWLCVPIPPDASPCTSGTGAERHGLVTVIYGSIKGYQTPSVNGTHAAGTDFYAASGTIMDGYGTETSASRPCSGGVPNICQATYFRNPVLANVNYGFAQLDHYFGASVAILNSDDDAFDDMVVAAPGFEDLRCLDSTDSPRDYGRLYLFKGSEYGIVAGETSDYYASYGPAQSCPLLHDQFNGDAALGTAITGDGPMRAIQPQLVTYGIAENETGRRFGSVMTTGDLDNDGFEDLVVGTPYEEIASFGAVGTGYVLYGPLCGTDNDELLGETFQMQGNLNKQLTFGDPALAGLAVNTACAKPSGLKLPPLKFFVLDGVDGDRYSSSLTGGREGRADVNGDGYDDILMGSYLWDHDVTGQLDHGRGVVFFGSPNGLFTADYAANSVVILEGGRIKPFAIVNASPESDLEFFRGKVSSGDINGDGTVDYMIPSATFDGRGAIKGINLGTFFMFY